MSEIGFALPAAAARRGAARSCAPCPRRRLRRAPPVCSASLDSGEQQAAFIRGKAATAAPRALHALLFTLQHRGQTLVSPEQRRAQQDLHPFLIPLATDAQAPNGAVTGLLRWPTPPAGMQLPVVSTVPPREGADEAGASHFQLTLLAPSADAYINRQLASADQQGDTALLDDLLARLPDQQQSEDAAPPYYIPGTFQSIGLTMPQFLILKVARYPDAYEQLAEAHRQKGDTQSALVTCETACDNFHGWARSHVYHAKTLQELGRDLEMRDAARFALQMPLWTVGSQDVQELAAMAGYRDPASLGKIYKQLSEDIRETEIAEGKAPQQVALDRAAYLLDYAVAEKNVSSWSEITTQLAELYEEGMMPEIASFIRS